MPTLPHQLVVNRAAIARLTGVNPRRIVSFECEFDDLVVVTVKPSKADPRKAIVLSLAQLEEEFHRFRREGSEGLVLLSSRPSILNKNAVIHRVEGQGADEYLLEETDLHLSCTCEDWHQHATICKHGWTVLNAYGATTVKELRENRAIHEREALRLKVVDIKAAAQYSRPKAKSFKGVDIE